MKTSSTFRRSKLPGALGRTLGENLSLTRVARQGCRVLEFAARLVEAAELTEQVSAYARQQVVLRERGLSPEPVDDLEGRRGPAGHAHGDRAIELHDGRRQSAAELLVEDRDPLPVRLFDRRRPSVARGDRGLEGVRAGRAAERLRARERFEAAANQD